jgi:hypothetical protein
MIISFPKRTTARVKGLSEYFHREVLTADLGFICRHWDQCRTSCRTPNFYEGQLHHIGHHYDLEIDGRPTRIVIVGQEYGHSPPRVSLKKRHFTESGNTKGFRGRNPHMRGTTTLLRLVLGRDPGEDFAGEQLLVKPPIHIFEGFALVNFLLCSAVDKSKRGQSTPTMRHNCAEHFRAAIEILDPTIIIAEGFGVRAWIGDATGLPQGRGPIEPISFGAMHATLLTFAHPSAPGPYGWWGRSIKSAYLNEIVIPTVRSFTKRLAQGRR